MASNSGEVFAGGATTSQHIDAEDDDHFENTTFKLKRTRSLGLLDEFIDPSEQKSNEDITSLGNNLQQHQQQQQLQQQQQQQSPKLSIKSPEMVPHDDMGIADEPQVLVDYLSHHWDISDISKSWRYVISKRKDVANSARLENVSWRTWAQRKSNLKTINPEEVNWSKESDVTWLYGPILKDEDHDLDHQSKEEDDFKRETTATSAVAGDISIADKSKKGPKPILKRRTVEDIIISHSNLLKLQLATNRMQDKDRRRNLDRIAAVNNQYDEEYKGCEKKSRSNSTGERPPEYFDYDAISSKLNSQYKNLNSTNPSESNLSGMLNSSTTSLRDRVNQLAAEKNQKSPLLDKSKSTSSLISSSSSPSSFDNSGDDLNPHLRYSAGTPMFTPSNKNNEAITDLSLQKEKTAENFDDATIIPKSERHIHFNDEVQQCIAVDEFSQDEYDDETDYYYDEDEDESYIYDTPNDINDLTSSDDSEDDGDDDDEEDEGGFFLNVKSPSSANISGVPGLTHSNSKETANVNDNTEDTESISTSNSKMYRTIQLLPPTTLNYGSSDEESDEENPYTSSLSHNSTNRGYDYYYDYNSVYTVDPNHAIYGSNSSSSINSAKDLKSHDVVDVPENITLGSNFDYEIIENENFEHQENPINYGQLFPQHDVLPKNEDEENDTYQISFNPKYAGENESNNSKIPISSLEDSKGSAFDLDDNSDDDSDDGILIKPRSSSQSLAQLIFGNTQMTPAKPEEHHYPVNSSQPQPVEDHISSINPNHSTTSLSKQPHSSNSLADLFFLGGPTQLTKNRNSSKMLASQFFNREPEEQEEKHDEDVSFSSNNSSYFTAPSSSRQQLSDLPSKSSPLPPYINSSNAFSGTSSPPLESSQLGKKLAPPKKNTFVLDSESESEDETNENNSTTASPTPHYHYSPTGEDKTSYSSLSQVADRNGIRSPSPEDTESSKNLVGQAKGLANHLLGNWKNE